MSIIFAVDLLPWMSHFRNAARSMLQEPERSELTDSTFPRTPVST